MENIDYEGLKGRGFLRQRQEGFFIFRTRMSEGVYKKGHLIKLAAIAEKYGKGFIHATVRQGMEIPFISLNDIPAVEADMKAAGIKPGTSGARLRAVTCCPGNNWCKAGLVDTFSLFERIEKELGIKCGMDLPHKFKIAISGCPNTCTRAQAAEIGIHGQAAQAGPSPRSGFIVYLGGCGGRSPRSGLKLDNIFTEDEVLMVIARVVKFYKENAKSRQRLGVLIDETGKERFLKALAI
jgi:dissimilatory sulfite reductase (desulfoviridin) alpha/beta subunit